MSLMQLLAVGRSIRTIQDRPTPYRMAHQGMLPRFGAALGVEKREPPELAQAPRNAAPVKAGGGEARELAGSRSRRGRWCWGWARRGGRERAGAGPVQGELALETVKVVRNDLSDSDVEVIPAGRPTGAPGERELAGGASGEARNGRWMGKWGGGWLARRVLGERRG